MTTTEIKTNFLQQIETALLWAINNSKTMSWPCYLQIAVDGVRWQNEYSPNDGHYMLFHKSDLDKPIEDTLQTIINALEFTQA